MIFEMTRDYSIIVPLMISNLISFLVSYAMQRQPIYEALAHQEGINLPAGESRDQLERLQAGNYMQPEDRAFPDHLDVSTAVQRLKEARVNTWPVARGGLVLGMAELKHMGVGDGNSGRTVKDTVSTLNDAVAGPAGGKASKVPFIHPDQSLSLALEKMGAAGVDTLPVVSRANTRQILGVLTLPDILNAYGVMAYQEKEPWAGQPSV